MANSVFDLTPRPTTTKRLSPIEASQTARKAFDLLAKAEAELPADSPARYRIQEAGRALRYRSDGTRNFLIEGGDGLSSVFVSAFNIEEVKAFAALIGRPDAQVSEWDDWSAPELKQKRIKISLTKSVREFALALAAEAAE